MYLLGSGPVGTVLHGHLEPNILQCLRRYPPPEESVCAFHLEKFLRDIDDVTKREVCETVRRKGILLDIDPRTRRVTLRPIA
jgi:hypothetical protein